MTFTYTLEELRHSRNRADKMRKRFKEQIAEALLQERLSRKLKLSEVSEAVKIPFERIEALELGTHKSNWKYIGILLKYYGKMFQVSLVNNPVVEEQDEQ